MTQTESAILTLSDLHFGKLTSTYSPETFAKRLDGLGEKLGRIRELLSDYAFDELVIAGLGDWNDGTGIYATQAHEQAITNVEEQADVLSDLLASFLTGQRKVWKRIRCECVAGNHGRAGKFAHVAANWDVTCFRYLGLKLRLHNRPVIPVNFDGDDLFIRKIEARKHSYLLYHGHEIRMYQTIPWYSTWQRALRWYSSEANGKFEAMLMGHFHSAGEWQLNRFHVLLSGTFVTDDKWAMQTLGLESCNTMWLFGVSDSRPITWRFALDVG